MAIFEEETGFKTTKSIMMVLLSVSTCYSGQCFIVMIINIIMTIKASSKIQLMKEEEANE